MLLFGCIAGHIMELEVARPSSRVHMQGQTSLHTLLLESGCGLS